ncbi:MAG: UvrD-helicase domain-containing protein, partial [Patescibacteria group bacterium]
MSTDSNQKNFNPQQTEAIQHGSGPLLIIAGAGTGKTMVITQRIKHLIESGQAKSEEILALTFTEKAANEMETRVDQLLPLGYTQLWILTFHSFCDRVLRSEGLHIGLPPDYELLTGVNSLSFFKKHFFNFDITYFRPLGNPYKFIEALLQHFSRLKDEDITPEQYSHWAQDKGDPEKELA